MKLGSLKNGTRDGALCVVSRDLKRACVAHDVAPSLQAALDDWEFARPRLELLHAQLDREPGAARHFDFDPAQFLAPLPRAVQWLDASVYLNHIELVRRALGVEAPEGPAEPIMYQGSSCTFLGPCDDVPVENEDWGIDLEGEVAIVTGDVPMAVKSDKAAPHIRLLMLMNDVSLRTLIGHEMSRGFGFLHSKTWTSFAPVAVTPDELGDAWDGRKLRLPLRVAVNGTRLGEPNAGVDMAYSFTRLMVHAARTRPLPAGTIIGAGTVSNRDRSAGSACLAERRAIETIETGEPVTPYLRFGDQVRIEMLDGQGRSVFGAIDQKIVRYGAHRPQATEDPATDA